MFSNVYRVSVLTLVMALKVTIATPVLVNTSDPKDFEKWSDTAAIWTFESIGMINSNETENILYEKGDGAEGLSCEIIHHMMGDSDTRSHLASKLSDRNNFSN